MIKQLTSMGQEMTAMGAALERHTPKAAASITKSTGDKISVMRGAAGDIRRRAYRMNLTQVHFRESTRASAENFLKRFRDVGALPEALVPTMTALRDVTRDTREKLEGLRNAVVAVRENDVEVELNEASDYYLLVLNDLLDDFDAYIRFTEQAIALSKPPKKYPR